MTTLTTPNDVDPKSAEFALLAEAACALLDSAESFRAQADQATTRADESMAGAEGIVAVLGSNGLKLDRDGRRGVAIEDVIDLRETTPVRSPAPSRKPTAGGRLPPKKKAGTPTKKRGTMSPGKASWVVGPSKPDYRWSLREIGQAIEVAGLPVEVVSIEKSLRVSLARDVKKGLVLRFPSLRSGHKYEYVYPSADPSNANDQGELIA